MRISRDITITLAAGALSGVGSLLVVTGALGVIAAYLAPAPLFAAAFRFGLANGLLSAVAGTIAGALTAAALAGPEQVLYGIGYAVATALPVLVIARFALLSRPDGAGGTEWYPGGRLMTVAITLAAILVAGGWLFTLGAEGGLRGEVARTLEPLIALMAADAATADAAALADGLAGRFVAFAACFWVVQMVLSGLLGRFAAERLLGGAMRPLPSISTFDPPEVVRWVLMAGLALTLVVGGDGDLGLLAGVAAVLASMPYLVLGLGVAHGLARRTRGGGFILAAVYMLALMLRWPILLIVILGFVERWAGLRHRSGAA
ncbi:hypothetical protein GCM10011505_34500 [Tistrella bauzanensis]|uniref:DUF2232 domain-containing protein n=1 Tax=Tistrella bauzanensis TaxID=657419 RepID=A0ABQ1IS35_9PROT|nr:hypothetical protein [Tistrella bauzanensis]GGB50542.1 hypothetical protein GCM10011505_34500 [Tistrella bauzanensis]